MSLSAVYASTCSTTPSAIFYTSGSSTYTVSRCLPTTIFVTHTEAVQNATSPPTTVYLSGSSSCPSLESSLVGNDSQPTMSFSESAMLSSGIYQATASATTTVYITQTSTCPVETPDSASVAPSLIYTSQPSVPLPLCNSTSDNSQSGKSCQDSFGNTFNLAADGVQLTGDVARQISAADFNACLLSCDQTPGCVAANYIDGSCTLLNSVTGQEPISYGIAGRAAAAFRPSGVNTVYTTGQNLPTSTAAATTTVFSYQNFTVTSNPSTCGFTSISTATVTESSFGSSISCSIPPASTVTSSLVETSEYQA